MRLPLITILALLATPAVAYFDKNGREIHSDWSMTCYPSDARPFTVVASTDANVLTIQSGRGPIRVNHIISIHDEGNGFHVTAEGEGKYGLRLLNAHFSFNGGYMQTTPATGPAIQCGADIPLSDD